MQVIFIHGPAASGKHTVGTRLATLTGLPLFHNHLAVDAATALFDFGTPGFRSMRAAIWRTAFREAAEAGRSFIFTFHPEATVDPALIDELVASVVERGGSVFFVRLHCRRDTLLQRLGEPTRAAFGKLVDPGFYEAIERQGAFRFPPLPREDLVIDTDLVTPDAAAESIARSLKQRPMA